MKTSHKQVPQVAVFVLTIFISLFLNACSGANQPTDSPIDSNTEATISVDTNMTQMPEESPIISIAESVLYQENGILIKVTDCQETVNGYEIFFYIQNDSSLNLGFNAHAYAVNGLMTGNNIYDMDCDVSAGNKANAKLEIGRSALDTLGITSLKNIDILFWAYDNDKLFKAFDTKQLSIATNQDDGTRDFFVGSNLYSDQGVQVDYLGCYGEEYIYAVKNSTGTYFDFDVENLNFNDYTDSSWKISFFDTGVIRTLTDVIVLNDCQAIIAIAPDSEFLELNQIEQIQKIEFTLNITPEEESFDAQGTRTDWDINVVSTDLS